MCVGTRKGKSPDGGAGCAEDCVECDNKDTAGEGSVHKGMTDVVVRRFHLILPNRQKMGEHSRVGLKLDDDVREQVGPCPTEGLNFSTFHGCTPVRALGLHSCLLP